MRKNITPLVVAFFSITEFLGCASAPKPIQPSVHVMATNKTASELIPDLENQLKQSKYKVKRVDANLAFITTEPRTFSIDTAKGRLNARQSIQLRQEGGSLKLRVQYKCENISGVWGDCFATDSAVPEKISRLDKLLVSQLSTQLFKERTERPQSTNIEASPEASPRLKAQPDPETPPSPQ